ATGLRQRAQALRLVRQAIAQQHTGAGKLAQEQLAAHRQEQCAQVPEDIADATGQPRPAALDHAGRAVDDDLAHGRLAGAVDAAEPGLQAGGGLTVLGWRLAHETLPAKSWREWGPQAK